MLTRKLIAPTTITARSRAYSLTLWLVAAPFVSMFTPGYPVWYVPLLFSGASTSFQTIICLDDVALLTSRFGASGPCPAGLVPSRLLQWFLRL
jgi:hypothetical protein